MFKRKMTSLDRDDILRAKNEALSLLRYHSYEEIGKAFMDASRELSYDDIDDVVKARFVHRVSFNCFLAMQVRTSKLYKETPPKPASRFSRLLAFFRGR